MRDSYFEKLIRYIKNVYHVDKAFNDLTDKRVYPEYKTKQIATLIMIAFMLRIESFNDLKFILERKKFCKLYREGTKFPKIDTFRDSSKKMCVKFLQLTQCRFIQMMKSNNVSIEWNDA